MYLCVGTQRSIEWTFGTLPYLEVSAPGDPAIVLLHGLGSYVPLTGLGHVVDIENPSVFESGLLPLLQLEKA